MDEGRDMMMEIEDLMRRFGYQEKEAAAAYHLGRAQHLFDEIFGEDESRLMQIILHMPHFSALRGLLARRVLERNYPEGWGREEEDE